MSSIATLAKLYTAWRRGVGDMENGYGCKRKKERKIRIRMEEAI